LEILSWHTIHTEKSKECRTGNELLFKKLHDENQFKSYDLQSYQKLEESLK
jgi:hypothetical protein